MQNISNSSPSAEQRRPVDLSVTGGGGGQPTPACAAWPPLDRHTGLDHWTHHAQLPAALGACRMSHVGQQGPENVTQTPQIPAFVGCLHSAVSPDTELEAGVGRQVVHLKDGDVIQGGFTPKAATRERQSSDSKQRPQWVPYGQHGAWGLSSEPPRRKGSTFQTPGGEAGSRGDSVRRDNRMGGGCRTARLLPSLLFSPSPSS